MGVKPLGENARGASVAQVFPNKRAISQPRAKEAMERSKAKGNSGAGLKTTRQQA
ncbi:hypothetical protein [Polaromonas sp. OV174]|uniref:hypothetical protein n=1 Tax=Polaromonas sp. OV174 TaxID=1855300 RepID=UPI0015A72B1D|nr:hypothetical protein [Polaromonas sp. OV174]